MMKQLFISVFMATACTLGVSAQSIEVTDTAGISYKFPADKVESITFVQTTDPSVQAFSAVEARAYSSGAVEATFSNPAISKTVTLWIVGPSMGKYLHEGVYTVSSESGEMIIDADKYYSYVTENGTNTTLQSGTMTVSVTGKTYNIYFDLMLSDGNELKGQYQGAMPGLVGKNVTLNPCVTPKVTTTDINGYVPGEYYFNMNDASWNYEMAIDFYADANTKKLPAGTYSLSADKTPGTFNTRSYLSLYSPSVDYKFAEGSTVTVAYEEDSKIILTLNLITEDGRQIDMEYSGEITFPEVVAQKETVALATSSTPKVIDNNGRVDGEFYTKFNDASWNYEMAIDFFANSSETKLPAGTYTYSADNTPGTFGSKSYIDMWSPNLGSSCRFAEGSTVKVSYDGDNVVMDFNLLLVDKDYILTMKYEGSITYEF